MSNDSIDKLADIYASDEEDAKAYQKAQQSTIITQTRQLNEARKKLEELSKQVEQLTIENTRLKALGPADEKTSEVSDAETICLVQLALLNSYSMQRELTLEECKKAEIYSKTMLALRSKAPEEKKESASSLSNEELMAALKELG